MQSPNSNLLSRNHVILILHLTPYNVKVYGQNNATSEDIVLKRDIMIIVFYLLSYKSSLRTARNDVLYLLYKYLMATFIAAMTVLHVWVQCSKAFRVC